MRPRKRLLLAVLTLCVVGAQGQNQYQVLHSFGLGSDGAGLWGSVAFDREGNLYGTTSGGGVYGSGTVFEVMPQGNGEWTESVLYSFCSDPGCPDGTGPFGGLTLDSAGDLYGTTQLGGAHGYPGGTVFELIPGSGGWTEATLYSFCGQPHCSDGEIPLGTPVLDRAGNLYGTAGGAFELSSDSGGNWSEIVLHDFLGQNGDGFDPQAGPILDRAGNLYGTTRYGGAQNAGIVYQLQPVSASVSGTWKERILHTFGGFFGGDGGNPGAGQLAMDRFGSLYGTTQVGGTGYGTVFKLTHVPVTPSGVSVETILYNFTPAAYGPGGGVTFDRAGNLYGTTIYGGGTGCGVVYELSPVQGGKWQYTLLHSFLGSDGCQPDANLTLGPDGNLYGTTATGGAGGAGVVFEIQIAP